jgi:hypothetical protein
MRFPLAILSLWVVVDASAQAQSAGGGAPQQDEAPAGKEIAFGVSLTPAWEIPAGLWFTPGIRLSASFGSRLAIDVDAGRLFGADTESEQLRRSFAALIRWKAKTPSGPGSTSFWSVGYARVPITWLRDEPFAQSRKTAHTALLIAHGWEQAVRQRRVAAEIGFSGGDGYLLYSTITVQLRLLHRSQ